MQFNRSISTRLVNLTEHFKVVVLTGARQTGKTTLLRSLFPSRHFVSLDLPQHAALAEESPSQFLARYPPPLTVDEVQYAPLLFRHLKSVVDATNSKGQFILTGSQRFVLMKSVSESLAGRAAVLQLHPFAAEELGDALFGELERSGLSGVLSRGFYPALWEDLSMPIADFFHSYVSTWLERDLRQMLNIGSLRDFDRFLRACAARSAQLLNKSELARDVGIAVSTVTQWLSVLEASGLIVILEPFFANHTKRIIKSPKLYLTDVGLLTFLLGLDAAALLRWSGVGGLWETLVLGELVRWRDAHHPEATLNFFRDKDGNEADFVIQRGGTLTILDAKLSELPDPRSSIRLKLASSKLTSQGARLALVTPTTTESFPLSPGIDVVSGWQLPKWLDQ
jgi:predicted AAA+ superfamily ATPase